MSKYVLFFILIGLVACQRGREELSDGVSVENISMQPPPATESFVPNLEGPLRPISVSPAGALNEVEPGQRVSVTFSTPMIALGEALPVPAGQISLDPATEGTLRWEGTQTLVFEPAAPLDLATSYVATLQPGLQALNGSAMDEPYSWTFETPRPRLTGSNPRNNEPFVDPAASFELYFNQPLDADRIAPFLSILRQTDNTELPVTISTAPGNVVILNPEDSLQKGTYYTIQVRAGIPGPHGPLPSAGDASFSIRTYPPFAFQRISQEEYGQVRTDDLDPARGVLLEFSTNVAFQDLLEALTITPEVDIPPGLEARGFVSLQHRLPLFWEPETRYTLRIDSLQDVHGQWITSAALSFNTASYKPSVRIPSGLLVVEAEEQPALPMHVTNVETVDVGLERLRPEDILSRLDAYDHWYNYSYYLDIPGQAAVQASTPVQLDIETNVPEVKPFDLSAALVDSFGLVGVHLAGPRVDNRDQHYKALVQVTRMGISAKFSPHQNLFFVTDLKTASPVPQAEVTVRGPDNAVYWQGTTDEAGLARSPGWFALQMPQPAQGSPPAQFVFVEKDGDAAFTSSLNNRGLEPYRFGIGGWDTELEDWTYDLYAPAVTYRGLLFTDRGLYRAGETIHFKGLVRQKTDGEWAASTDSVEVVIHSPDGEETFADRFPLSPMGTFDFTWTSPESATLGSYYAYVRRTDEQATYIAGDYVRIDAFRRATFSVDVNTSAPQYVAGDFLEGAVSGRYLFGTAMQEQPVRYTIRKTPGAYEPPGYPGYQFAPVRRGYGSYDYGYALASGDTLLDAEGQLYVRTRLPGSEEGRSAEITFSATVTDPARQEGAGQTKAVLHPGLFYLGLKPETRFLDLSQNQAAIIDVISVTPGGQPISVDQIDVELVREQWNSVREVGADGRLRWRSERTEEILIDETIRTDRGQARRLTVPVAEGGSYVFRARAVDVRGNTIQSATHFYATGGGYVAWQRSDDDLIALTPERTTYEPGETARILVQSPYEEATALITIEREGILSSEVRTLRGSAPQIEIPLTEAHMPNVFVSVMMLTGRTGPPEGTMDPGAPAFKIGYTALHVDPGTRRLTVEVLPDETTYRPGDEATVDLRLVDASGRGVAGEIAFSAADAGVLNLINYTLPDPFHTFYGPRPLNVITSQTLASLVKQRNYGQKEDDEGGGGGMDAEGGIRRDFRPLAYWNPSIQTDERGRATVRFELPESLTTFRFMASALTADNQFGQGQADVVVTKPLVLKPALPRFARLGDAFEAGVLITNTTGASGQAVVQGSAEDISLDGEASKTRTVDHGATREVRFAWEATAPGEARFTFDAVLGRESDAFEVTLPILLPTIKQTQATFASTDDQSVEELRLPAGLVTELGHFEAQVSSTALVGLEGAARYLFQYPYGCLEQRTSRIRPLIAGEALLDVFDLEVLDGTTGDLIQAWVHELRSYWNGQGFSLWPGGGYTNHYVSAYVVLAMAEARDAGYDIPERLLDDAVAALERSVRSSEAKPDYVGQRTWNDTRAFILYTLARHDRFLDQELHALATQALAATQPISLDGQSHLLRTLLRRDNPSYASLTQSLIRRLTDRLRVEGTTAYLTATQDVDARWIFASDTRSTAFGLTALIESEPPEENRRLIDLMVRYLIQTRQAGHWASTQENAAVIEAFALFRKRYEEADPSFTAEVTLAGNTILQQSFQGRSLEPFQEELPLSGLPVAEPLPVVVRKSGTGQLYYTLRLESYSAEPVEEALSQGLSVQRTMERIDDSGIAQETVAPNEAGLRTLQAGEMVRVTLRLTSPADRNYVVVDDPLPAGLETLNAAFATTDGAVTRGTGSDRWWGSFNHSEMRDDRVVLFADYLTRGEHTYTYVARATVPGTFVHPPAQAELMYQPEINGRNASGTLIVQAASKDMAVQ